MRPRTRAALAFVVALLATCGGRSSDSPAAGRNTVTIAVTYPGAATAEIETDIVVPIENALADIPGVLSLRACGDGRRPRRGDRRSR